MRRLPFLFSVLLLSLVLGAQPAPDALNALNARFREHVGARDYAAALVDLDEMLSLKEIEALPGARGSLLYNQACLNSLLGRKAEMLESIRAAVAAGYTKYDQYAHDADFDAFRSDADFAALLADIKARFGPKPLVWDRSVPAPPFRQTFDRARVPGLARLRSEFGLDAAVSPVRGTYERLIAITRWASAQWQHSPNQMASKADPITILTEAKAGGRFICRDYAIVTASAAAAYGMPSRMVNLLPADVETRSEAHAVAEVWVAPLGTWVIADGQFGIVPELDGVPLSAVELQAALAGERPVVCRGNESRCAEWKRFILPNLYYFKTVADQRRFDGKAGSMLILVPKGAPNPHKFAGGNEELFAGAVYTSNPASFYKGP
jgi:hypothetical protein